MIPGNPQAMDEEGESPLAISAATVSYIIERAREAWSGLPVVEGDDADAAEHRGADADFIEIAEFIDDLNEEERIDLVVLMWIGRGTYSIEELERARRTAEREATHKTSEYLLSTPQVVDYLAEGLEAFGLTVEED